MSQYMDLGTFLSLGFALVAILAAFVPSKGGK